MLRCASVYDFWLRFLLSENVMFRNVCTNAYNVKIIFSSLSIVQGLTETTTIFDMQWRKCANIDKIEIDVLKIEQDDEDGMIILQTFFCIRLTSGLQRLLLGKLGN